MLKSFVITNLVLLLTIPLTSFSQHEHETSSEVPELWEFHDVIYQIWHEAWPEKNTDLLTQLIPDIEAGYQKLANAEFPGILRDKRDKWTNGLEKMKATIEFYKQASANKNDQALLDAAEELHSQFENLVHLIRPILKEIDVFHQELYLLYHYYLPEYNFEKIKSSTGILAERLQQLMHAELPKRLQSKQSEFENARKELAQSVYQLKNAVNANLSKESIETSIEEMHSDYQAVIAIFE